MSQQMQIPGNLTTDGLAATITKQEQLNFTELKALATDPKTAGANVGTFADQPNPIGALFICNDGIVGKGTKLFSTKAYVGGTLTSIDVYRVAVS